MTLIWPPHIRPLTSQSHRPLTWPPYMPRSHRPITCAQAHIAPSRGTILSPTHMTAHDPSLTTLSTLPTYIYILCINVTCVRVARCPICARAHMCLCLSVQVRVCVCARGSACVLACAHSYVHVHVCVCVCVKPVSGWWIWLAAQPARRNQRACTADPIDRALWCRQVSTGHSQDKR